MRAAKEKGETMDLGRALSTVGEVDRAASFQIFSQSIDPEWIQQALAATGSATVRRRKLPAEFVLWIVIGMALLRDRSIQEVVRHLNLVLPDPKLPRNRGSVTGAAIVQARDRLGPEAMVALFTQTASLWASASADRDRWRGLAVYGVDGTTLRVPDTEENEKRFGLPGSSRGRSAYPQLRVLALMVLRSHILADMAVGPYGDSEQKLRRSARGTHLRSSEGTRVRSAIGITPGVVSLARRVLAGRRGGLGLGRRGRDFVGAALGRQLFLISRGARGDSPAVLPACGRCGRRLHRLPRPVRAGSVHRAAGRGRDGRRTSETVSFVPWFPAMNAKQQGLWALVGSAQRFPRT